MKRLLISIILIVLLYFNLDSHSGRTDANGGHYNRKTGSYHYHSSKKKETSSQETSLPKEYKTNSGKKTKKTVEFNTFKESDWQVAFNSIVTNGEMEVIVSSGRIDILTEQYAIEVDKVINYQEGLKQALQYAKSSKRLPGLALYFDGEGTLHNLDDAREQCKVLGIQIWLINEYVSTDYLVIQKYSNLFNNSSTLTDKVDLDNEKTFWLNTKSSVRHNRSCRWFENTKSGRNCNETEGRACGQCGG